MCFTHLSRTRRLRVPMSSNASSDFSQPLLPIALITALNVLLWQFDLCGMPPKIDSACVHCCAVPHAVMVGFHVHAVLEMPI